MGPKIKPEATLLHTSGNTVYTTFMACELLETVWSQKCLIKSTVNLNMAMDKTPYLQHGWMTILGLK